MMKQSAMNEDAKLVPDDAKLEPDWSKALQSERLNKVVLILAIPHCSTTSASWYLYPIHHKAHAKHTQIRLSVAPSKLLLFNKPAMSKVNFSILYIFQHERESFIFLMMSNQIMAEFEI